MPMTPLELPDKTCLKCGGQFNRTRFGNRLEDASRFKSRKYCSKRCASFRENPKYWNSEIRERARALRKKSCEGCGSKNKLHAHHENGNLYDNTPENIRTLCGTCHRKHHWRLWKRGIFFNSYDKHSYHKKRLLTELPLVPQDTEKNA